MCFLQTMQTIQNEVPNLLLIILGQVKSRKQDSFHKLTDESLKRFGTCICRILGFPPMIFISSGASYESQTFASTLARHHCGHYGWEAWWLPFKTLSAGPPAFSGLPKKKKQLTFYIASNTVRCSISFLKW